MDFPGAGAFLPALAPPPGQSRVCVASTGAGQDCLLANAGTVSFSQYFLSEVFNGLILAALSKHARVRDLACQRAVAAACVAGRRRGRDRQHPGWLAGQSTLFGTPFLTGADMPVLGGVMPDTTH